MTIEKAPTRPALRYYGGKWNLAPWIISHFPKHLNYVEPCGGAASVLLQKPRSPLETYNDLDGNVVNFFRVLRDQPDELVHRLELTPYARAEYQISYEPCTDDIERARRFFTACSMSIVPIANRNFRPNLRSCRFVNRSEQISALPLLNTRDFSHLYQVAQRFIGVQIENDDCFSIMEAYDNKDALIYFDPPYVEDTRTEGRIYAYEWSDPDHARAADLLSRCESYVIVNGYACPLYTDLYERHGWKRVDKEAQTNSGGKRIESLWLSPRTSESLAKPQQVGLF